jgi:hypothetical protein
LIDCFFEIYITQKSLKKKKQMNALTWFLVVLIAVWLLLLLPTVFFAPTSLQVLHTYVLPAAAPIGRLTDDRWAFNNVREGLLLIFYVLFPWTLVLMLWSKEHVGWWTHLVFILLFWGWGLTNFIADIWDWSVANVGPSDPAFIRTNNARDSRWCCLFGGQPGTSDLCANSIPCSGGGILQANLVASNTFVYRFIANCFFMLLSFLDFYYILSWTYSKQTPLNKKGK